MIRTLLPIVTFLLWFASSGPLLGDEQESARRKIIDRVDALLLARMEQDGVEPAPLSDDAEFLRRVSLDLGGVIPSVARTREFLEGASPDKRKMLVERLLTSPTTINHLAETWRNAMLPAGATPELLRNSVGLHAWLRDQFSNNLRYDRLVSDLIASTGTEADGPALFFTALDLEPKKLAASTARIFLGLQIECAECHDHPFDDWSQQDFWAYAAFFARLPRRDMPSANFRLTDRPTGEVTLPETDQVVLPKYPGGRQADEKEAGTRRQQLSIWIASPDNPFLARAAVNRVWALLFGRGLVQPVDDLGPHNPASHPELFSELTDYFIDSRYDLKELLRTLCNTKAYARSSAIDAAAAPNPALFAAMAVKVLTAEQVFDSLSRCLSQGESYAAVPLVNYGGRRQMFLARMVRRSADATDYDRGLQQALHLMNGAETSEATDLTRSALLTSLEAPFLTDEQRIEILFLATLSRFPREDEMHRVRTFAQEFEKPDEGLSTAYADILWALLNSAEFTLNH